MARFDNIKSLAEQKFLQYQAKLNGDTNSPLHLFHKSALDKLLKTEFPTRKDEVWKYTNIDFLNNINFDISLDEQEANRTVIDIEKYVACAIPKNLLVFINGHYSEIYSKIHSRHKGVYIGNLKNAFNKYQTEILHYLQKLDSVRQDAFSYLNTTIFQDGAFIYLPEGKTIEEPICILSINNSTTKSIVSQPRNIIIANECSKANIVEMNVFIGEYIGFTNTLTDIIIKPFANIEYNRILNNGENSHYIGNTYIEQDSASIFNSIEIFLNGKFSKNILNVSINNELCETNLYGLYFAKEDNFVDYTTVIEHKKPNSKSNQLYKGILDEQSNASFSGKIIVHKDAQKTNAYQANKNILLSDKSTIYSRPQLEIYADDVKCSHGATSGYLDQDALFYLMSRGISFSKAKALLLNAFASEIVEKINISELRDIVKQKIATRLLLEDIYFCDVLELLN